MFVDVILARSQIQELLCQFAPVRIHLSSPPDDKSWVELDEPREITMVEGSGVRVVCTGRLRYTVAGIQLPLAIRHVQVLLQPRVVESGDEPRLEFGIQIEDADLENVPGLIDRAIVGKVNSALTPETTSLYWEFKRTLDKAFSMPRMLEPLSEFLLRADSCRVSVTSHGIQLRLHMITRLTREPMNG